MDAALEALHHAEPLLLLAVVLVAGTLFGSVAKRIGLPGITGQILGGVAIGGSGFALFAEDSLAGLEPITDIALSLIAVTVGAHLHVARLRNALRRLSFLLIAESTITPALVACTVYLLGGVSFELALLFGAVSIATAPATIVALVRETRSKGVFVKTLIAAVALNNMACIVVFEICRAMIGTDFVLGANALLLTAEGPVMQLLGPLALGSLAALALDRVTRLALPPDRLATAAVLALVLTSGLATASGISPMLACLALGALQTNLTASRSHLVDSVFANFEPAILTVFFTLAGMHLSFDHLELAGLLAALYFLARLAGKLLAADVALRAAQATERVRRNLGLALVPQAGVAVGLVLLIQEDPRFAEVSGLFAAVVLSVVTVNEIIGPVLTRSALHRAGEAGKDRLRLIDFLQEEHITTDFLAPTKEIAIARLVDLMLRSHSLHGVDRERLLASVLERESQGSTCLGGGLAVPHGILPEGEAMAGVMALSRRGLDFETPDGRPVHCMVLLGTAPEERERHLQVLAALARTVGTDRVFQERLFDSKSPAHAYELLHGEESEGFNYFMDDVLEG
jgi:Kef-type K+ transport system membrane component KefB/mannitol/fructose-specific phosphotransferase system IIA component (Ntr-type)